MIYHTISPDMVYFYHNFALLYLVQFKIEKSQENTRLTTRFNTNFCFGKFNLSDDIVKIDETIINHLSDSISYHVSIYNNFVLINGGRYARKFDKKITPLTIYFQFKLFQIQYFNNKLVINAKSMDGTNPFYKKNGKYITDTDLIIMEKDNKTILYNVVKNITKELDRKITLYNDDINGNYIGVSDNKIILFPTHRYFQHLY